MAKFTADMKYSKLESRLLFVDTNQCLIIYVVQDLDSCSLWNDIIIITVIICKLLIVLY
jgi:hypothetical protein